MLTTEHETTEIREVSRLRLVRRSQLVQNALLLSFLVVLGASGVYLLMLGHSLPFS